MIFAGYPLNISKRKLLWKVTISIPRITPKSRDVVLNTNAKEAFPHKYQRLWKHYARYNLAYDHNIIFYDMVIIKFGNVTSLIADPLCYHYFIHCLSN